MLLCMSTGSTCSRAPLWAPRDRHQALLVTPGQLQRLPERGKTVKPRSSQGFTSSNPCSAHRGGLLGASHPGSSPVSWLVHFHPSILLCDSVPRASSTGQTNKDLHLDGRGLWLTNTHTCVHTHSCTAGEAPRIVPQAAEITEPNITSCAGSWWAAQPSVESSHPHAPQWSPPRCPSPKSWSL